MSVHINTTAVTILIGRRYVDEFLKNLGTRAQRDSGTLNVRGVEQMSKDRVIELKFVMEHMCDNDGAARSDAAGFVTAAIGRTWQDGHAESKRPRVYGLNIEVLDRVAV